MTSTLGMTLVLGALLAAAFGAVVGIEGGLRHRAGALKIVLGGGDRLPPLHARREPDHGRTRW